MKIPTQLQVDRPQLLQALTSSFAKGELRTLCFELGIEAGNLPETLDGMARELVTHCERHGRLLELVRACQEKRPHISWWDFVQETQFIDGTKPFTTAIRRFSWRPYIIGGVVLLVLAGLIGFVLAKFLSPTAHPHVSLAGLRYVVDGYDARLVDLRTAASSGIPVSSPQPLQLLELTISTSQVKPDCKVQAEIYADDDYIGHASSQPLNASLLKLTEIDVERYNHGELPQAWIVQPDWKNLRLALVTYCDGEASKPTWTTIRLNPDGKAWFINPPNVSFAAIVYTLNDGPPLVLDVRALEQQGLEAKPGHKLTLREIWYHANTEGDENQKIQLEAYLTAGGYVSETHKTSSQYIIQRGIQKLEFDPQNRFSWTIPEDRDRLVVTLAREDDAVLDRLILLLSPQGNPGLTNSLPPTLLRPDRSTLLDFEDKASDFEGWQTDFERSDDYAFTGRQSLQFSFSVTETSANRVFIKWNEQFKAEGLITHYYLPSEPNVDIRWLQFCVVRNKGEDWQCEYSPVIHTWDQWNAVIADLSKFPPKNGLPWNEAELSGFAMQGIITAAEPVTYSIYLDTVEIFEIDEP